MSTQKIYVGSNPNSFSLVDNSVTKILFYFIYIYCFLNITGEFMDEIGNEFGMI